ncbi:MAG: bifunctional phosphoribosyl-AMP cyclohydrolase/phosphoribosyl-ATP diphosphatase HisIE [Proteobacteria bacterium]|nr:bifunctional phosphoribosyl-AMP cyclohydrolase/phosphoribosyl-ATP diphosphatase HisIE [Pseudomonadota bacterium]
MDIDDLNYDDKGLIPAIIQDSISFNVVMLGYMNKDSLQQTLNTGEVTFFSRSKQRLWTKGETSGNKLLLKSIEFDCDKDALLVKAKQLGPTCHLENYSCFKSEKRNSLSIIAELETVIDERKDKAAEDSYVASLLNKGVKEIAKKVTEEAGETSIAAVTNDGRLIDESADLLFHLLVLLKNQNYSFEDVLKELNNRSSN